MEIVKSMASFPRCNPRLLWARVCGLWRRSSCCLLWGWQIDHKQPDTFDLIGGLICLIGVAVIMYAPRQA